MSENDLLSRPSSRNFRSLYPLLDCLKPYWPQVLAVTVALVITSAVALSVGQGLRYLIDDGLSGASTGLLMQAIGIFFGLLLLLAIGSFIRFYMVSWVGERISANLRHRVFRHVIHLNPAFFESNLSSDIQSRITTDTSILQTAIGSSVSIAARNFIMLIGAVVLLVATHPKLAGLVLASVPLVIIPLLFFGRRVRRLSRDSQTELAGTGSYVSEVLRHIKVVQANLHEPEDIARFGQHVERAFEVAKKRILVRAVLVTLVIILMALSISGILWVGGQDIILGRSSPGDLAAFVFYAFLVVGAVGAISEVYSDLQRAAGATERLFELLSIRSTLPLPTSPQAMPDQAKTMLRFEQVDYAYASRPQTRVLQNVSFQIETGEYTALAGPSGAGKSTVFEMILRFYDPLAGTVRLADTDIRRLSLQDLRSAIALVPQNPVLFRGSIRENIAYAAPDASNQAVEAAAAAGHVLEFSEQLPEGLDTQVGEDGVLLSGGQCQRVAIARAILKKPKLLLLDEATSSLDAESEFFIRQALSELIAHTTALVITHRLATVQNADRILLLSQGRLIADGTHDQLMKNSPLYERLVRLQFHNPRPGADLQLASEGELAQSSV